MTPGGDLAAWRKVTIGPVVAPAGTLYAKVTVRGTPTGWTATGGIATQVTPGLRGAYAALLLSETTSTKFLQQAVIVSPLGW